MFEKKFQRCMCAHLVSKWMFKYVTSVDTELTMLMVMEPVPVVPHMSVAVNDKLAVVADKSRIGYAALALVDIVPTQITTNNSNSCKTT